MSIAFALSLFAQDAVERARGDLLTRDPSVAGAEVEAALDHAIDSAEGQQGKAEGSQLTTTLWVFLSLDAPDAAKVLAEARKVVGESTDLTLKPVLLISIGELEALAERGVESPEARELLELGGDYQIVGTAPLARRFGIRRVPAVVYETSTTAHLIYGQPDIGAFVRQARGGSR